MILEGEAIVLGIRKFREKSTIVVVFIKEHGMLSGLIRKCNLNPGNIVYVSWKARLVEHLGMLKYELLQDITPLVYNNREKLIILNNALFTLLKILPEKFPKPELYESFLIFIKLLACESWYKSYIKFELILLENVGFGIDLTKCTVTNISDVAFISPRTGKAVSVKVGQKYESKLFRIPKLLMDAYSNDFEESKFDKKEFIESLKITNYFLHKFFLIPMQIKKIKFRNDTISFFES